jgi:hypothetical protein
VIQTCGSSYDTVLYVRQDSCTGSQLACNDDTPGCATSSASYHGSRVTVSAVQGQKLYLVVDGYNGRAGSYVLRVTPPGVCGNGVVEGGEQCDGAASSACTTGQCDASCRCVLPPSGQPDLRPTISSVSVQLNTTVPAGDVAEGCATETTGRDLIRFGTFNENIGSADLYFGSPNCPSCGTNPGAICGNPAFVCAPAGGHGHPHYDNYAGYELINPQNGATVVSGSKRSFCLRDTSCSAGATAEYTCSNQGLSAGCGDLYGASLGCQYVDVTGVPDGSYQLRVTVDPFQRIAESNETNNVATVPVTLNRGSSPPVNACSNVAVIPAAGGTVTGSTSGSSTLSGCVSRTSQVGEKVFQWTPATSGIATMQTCGSSTTFDTVLYVREGSCLSGPQVACNDDTAGCAVNSGSSNQGHHGSRVSFAVTAGTNYYVVVDGYGGGSGRSSGDFTLTVTAP